MAQGQSASAASAGSASTSLGGYGGAVSIREVPPPSALMELFGKDDQNYAATGGPSALSICQNIAINELETHGNVYFVCDPPLQHSGTGPAVTFSGISNANAPQIQNPSRDHIIYGEPNTKGGGPSSSGVDASHNLLAPSGWDNSATATFRRHKNADHSRNNSGGTGVPAAPSTAGKDLFMGGVALQIEATFSGFAAHPVLDSTAANPTSPAGEFALMHQPHDNLTTTTASALEPYTTTHIVSAVDGSGNVLCAQLAIITLVRMPWNALPALVTAAYSSGTPSAATGAAAGGNSALAAVPTLTAASLLGVTPNTHARRSVSPTGTLVSRGGTASSPTNAAAANANSVQPAMPLGVLSLTIDLLPLQPISASVTGLPPQLTRITTGLLRRLIGCFGFTTTDPLNRLQLHAMAAEEASAQVASLSQTLQNRQRAAGGTASSTRAAAAAAQLEQAYKDAKYNAETLLHPSRTCLLKPFELYVMTSHQVAFEEPGRMYMPTPAAAAPLTAPQTPAPQLVMPALAATGSKTGGNDKTQQITLEATPPPAPPSDPPLYPMPIPSCVCTIRAEPPLIAKFPGRVANTPAIISLKDVSEAPFAMLFGAQSQLATPTPLITWLPPHERVTWRTLEIFPVSGWCPSRDSLQVKYAGTSFSTTSDGRLMAGKEPIASISATSTMIRLVFEDTINAPLSAFLPSELPPLTAVGGVAVGATTATTVGAGGSTTTQADPTLDQTNASGAEPLITTNAPIGELGPNGDGSINPSSGAQSPLKKGKVSSGPNSKQGATVSRVIAFLTSCVALQTIVKDAKDRELVPTNDRVICVQIVDRFGLRESSTSGLNGNEPIQVAAPPPPLSAATPSSAPLAMSGVSAMPPTSTNGSQQYEVFQLLQRVVFLRSGEKMNYL
eukprot:GILJ01012691.1.p1 GENE.GILJ01012691.1~~GILJ01012691.1.p1  ORF type:complete len:899 (+),score=180.81 GILJ01012691.1:1249-3945(+)